MQDTGRSPLRLGMSAIFGTPLVKLPLVACSACIGTGDVFL
jgi:hypothetical protein